MGFVVGFLVGFVCLFVFAVVVLGGGDVWVFSESKAKKIRLLLCLFFGKHHYEGKAEFLGSSTSWTGLERRSPKTCLVPTHSPAKPMHKEEAATARAPHHTGQDARLTLPAAAHRN